MSLSWGRQVRFLFRLTQTNREVWGSWRNHSNVTAGRSRVFELHRGLQKTEGTIKNWKHTEVERHHSEVPQ